MILKYKRKKEDGKSEIEEEIWFRGLELGFWVGEMDCGSRFVRALYTTINTLLMRFE